MTKPQFEPQLSPFKCLLYKWLDIFYDYESRNQRPNMDLLNEVQFYGLYLLKDKIFLKSVWQSGVSSLKMFKTVMDPKGKLEKLLPLLDVLCGQTSFSFA